MAVDSFYARYISGDISRKVLPWQIEIDTTNICNQDCYYCNTADFRNESPTWKSYDEYSLLLDRIYEWSKTYEVTGQVNNVIFSGGGEPMLFKGIERLIEKAIDYDYFVAINTNGTKLDKLLSINPEKLRKMAYVGLDVDSGIKETYEIIRRSKTNPETTFYKVRDSAKRVSELGVPIDVKILLLPENSSKEEIVEIFEYSKYICARSIHLRPAIINDVPFPLSDDIGRFIDECSTKYSIEAKLFTGRYEGRTYSKCHQMFSFPMFSADGNLYLCCEYKGREDLKLCSWTSGDHDWRDTWGSEKHIDMYNKFRTDFCKPCRPNKINNMIERSLTDRIALIKKSFI